MVNEVEGKKYLVAGIWSIVEKGMSDERVSLKKVLSYKFQVLSARKYKRSMKGWGVLRQAQHDNK